MIFGFAVGLVVLLALEFLFLVTCAANEWPEVAGMSFIITLATADFFFSTGVLTWVWTNPEILMLGFFGYFVLGTGWSFFKWLTYLKRSVNAAKDLKAEIYTKYSLEGDLTLAIETLKARRTDEEAQDSYLTSLQQDISGLRRIKNPPQASANKRRITSWIATWPFSVVWFIIDEPLKLIWDWFRGSYQRLSDQMWKSLTES